MTSPGKAVFFGILFGSLMVFLIATKIARPLDSVIASTEASSLTTQQEGKSPESGENVPDQACNLPQSYPDKILRWCSLIESKSSMYSLDPRLIAAVMLQESGGNPDAYSKSGAVGLMQVMPKDGIAQKFMCVNGPCFANRPGMDELFQPDFNVDYGARMLANLIERRGNWRDALKAYGPMDVGYHYADLVLNIYNNYQ